MVHLTTLAVIIANLIYLDNISIPILVGTSDIGVYLIKSSVTVKTYLTVISINYHRNTVIQQNKTVHTTFKHISHSSHGNHNNLTQ